MGKRHEDRAAMPAEQAALLREAVEKLRQAVSVARATLGAAERVLAATEAMQSARILDVTGLRLLLDDLSKARRSMDFELNDVVEVCDRLLDTLGARTRLILKRR